MESLCPLCGESEVESLFTKQEIPYFRCRKCQFVFAVPNQNPNLANSLEDYETSYIQYLKGGPEDESNFRALLEWLKQSCGFEGKRLLDVGCGSGKWVRFLRKQGIEAFGTEPSRALYEHYLQDEPYFYSLTVDQLLADPEGNRFNIITALDVLEHVEQPVGFLEDMAQLLNVGGTLFVSTPDLGSLSAKILGRHWHFFNRYHLSYFTKETLARTATRSGLELKTFSRRGRIRSVGYMLRFGLDFLFAGKRVPVPTFLDQVSIPINLFDTMYLAFQKVSKPNS